MGAAPDKIRLVLNKYSPKLHSARVVEKHYNTNLVKKLPKNELPRIVTTIPNDWDGHVLMGYRKRTVGLDEKYSRWHR